MNQAVLYDWEMPEQITRINYSIGSSFVAAHVIPWRFWLLTDTAAVIVDSLGAVHHLVYGTDYTCTGNAAASPEDYYFDGGMLTLLTSWTNCTLTMWRAQPFIRDYDISETGPLDVRLLNNQLDRQITLLQDLKERLGRAYVRNEWEIIPNSQPLICPTPYEGWVLGWQGGQLVNMPGSGVAGGGPMGPVGATGPQGPPGPQGDDGAPGNLGEMGLQGDPGPQGPQGPPGNQGQVGLQGPIGPVGPTGPQGAASTVPGPIGPQGPVGATGSQGPTGATGAASTVPGPQGPVGPTGPQGATGAQGPQGVAGPTGATGAGVPVGGATAQVLGKNSATNYDTGWIGPMLPLAGGTMTGSLLINGAALNLTGVGTTNRVIQAQTAGVARWNLILANSATESGSNVGSDFTIQRCTDAGAQIDAPLTINRSTGNATFNGSLTSNGLTSNAGLASAGVCSLASTVAAAGGTGLNIGGSGISYSKLPNIHSIGFGWTSPLVVWIDNSNVGTLTPVVSDIRLKENVGKPEGDALAELGKLQLISYDLPDPVDPTQPAKHFACGFSAQQIEPIVPEAVLKSPMSAVDPERDYASDPLSDAELMLSLDLAPLLARCVGAIQQLTAQVTTLEAKLAAR